ncbi:DinB family protein [Rhodoferax saidenbachensis]|uniref:Damage-inducible protein DinB n=1 Tax=Rhodoferax saidenbachensis TaxID=1484693 RepID=A0A1P8K6W0_9BURK|nr:DinB family protein [Rhodoferax saidenbachensis]APW41671.1 damage-inducible protein DinB [Rhodoferax saidenbachensis]
MDARAHFLTLARYNGWATRRLLVALEPVSDAQYRADAGLFFKSIHGTLNHLLVAEHQLWFRRFAEGLSPTVALNAEVEPDRTRLAAALQDGALRWEALIATWQDTVWDGALNYTNMRGQPQSLPFAATLAHVFNHATHHRGQITAALTALGHASPELDMVYLLQGQVP